MQPNTECTYQLCIMLLLVIVEAGNIMTLNIYFSMLLPIIVGMIS